MRILHTEASNGWGGQEIRILREAEGMRKRGHEIAIAVTSGGELAKRAVRAGFATYEIPLYRSRFLRCGYELAKIIRRHQIELINTHSSVDAWLAGLVGKALRKKIIRTRHLSTPIRGGVNGYTLYRLLTDGVITTCQATARILQKMTAYPPWRCLSIPTGVDLASLQIEPHQKQLFRQSYGIGDSDCLAGSACVLRSWKGVDDLLMAAHQLRELPFLKWLIVGSGSQEIALKERSCSLGLQNKVIFTGHLEHPLLAIASMDLFLLLSSAHEGVSQASLQAAALKKPLITTRIGGLGEVCLDGKTGFTVDTSSPSQVAEKVSLLACNPHLRHTLGENGHQLVLSQFTFEQMLDAMEALYQQI